MARRKRIASGDAPDQRNSRLLGLPAELRNRIYHYVFQDTVMKVRERRKPNLKRVLNTPPLLVTCKQIHYEAIGIYYNTATFEVLFNNTRLRRQHRMTTTRLPEFLQNIGKGKKDLISNIHLKGTPEFYGKTVGWCLSGEKGEHILREAKREIGQVGLELAPGVLKAKTQYGEALSVFTSEPSKVWKEFTAGRRSSFRDKLWSFKEAARGLQDGEEK